MARHATHGILSWQRQDHQEGAQLPWQLVRWVMIATFSQTMLIIACTAKQRLTRFRIPLTVCILVYHADKRFNMPPCNPSSHHDIFLRPLIGPLDLESVVKVATVPLSMVVNTCKSGQRQNKPMMSLQQTPFAWAHVANFNKPAAVCMWRRSWNLKKPDHISSLNTPAHISNTTFRTVWTATYRQHPLPMHQSVRHADVLNP